tara:strand:+ start:155 stop:622 length:468 start_codon:yes stop_codon:yes gene_type:complete
MIEDGALFFNSSDPSYLGVRKDGKWIKTDPITERMKDQEQLKALNQLLSLVIGGRIARQTEHLKSAPINRINHAQKIIADGELQEATRDLQDGYDGASKRLSQVERKIDSLKSLKVLAEMVEENVRDAALAAVREGANSDGYMFDEYNEWEGKYK